ncbi:MAG: UDP-N-acetylmuramoyl-L-alanine--D-glutamate ligase [Verrucomicrobiota bacterium]|nr:UDP-N-acetylmuramoyl-L-alanine--D-glutamate ligase [Verrucomicrobiota bacterium]
MEFIKNKHCLVIGAGASGEAAARLLLSIGARVTIQDEVEVMNPRLEKLQAEGVEVQTIGQIKLQGDEVLAVLSPGVDPARPMVQAVVSNKILLWSELELAYRINNCPVVAITGTNGKTTTTELITSGFQAAGKKAVAAGNIGLPFSEVVRQKGEWDVIILEVSSFQLEQIQQFRPWISVCLNITPDHLDRYATMEEYALAKLRIFKNQAECDFAVVNAEYDYPPLKARRVTFSAYGAKAEYELRDDGIYCRGRLMMNQKDSQLSGVHNAENIMATLAVAEVAELPMDKVIQAICAYKPLPHRCEKVAVVKGVTWINDSKATNIDALEKALVSYKTKVRLIAGGKDKGFDFSAITDQVRKFVVKAYLIGQMQEKLAKAWGEVIAVEKVETLENAVKRAYAEAKDGEVVILSPGCSSYDQFKSYEHRGEQFRQFVLALSANQQSQKPNIAVAN